MRAKKPVVALGVMSVFILLMGVMPVGATTIWLQVHSHVRGHGHGLPISGTIDSYNYDDEDFIIWETSWYKTSPWTGFWIAEPIVVTFGSYTGNELAMQIHYDFVGSYLPWIVITRTYSYKIYLYNFDRWDYDVIKDWTTTNTYAKGFITIDAVDMPKYIGEFGDNDRVQICVAYNAQFTSFAQYFWIDQLNAQFIYIP